MNSLQTVVLLLSLSYAVVGALLLVVLVYARLRWSAKAAAVIVTSAFYVANFIAVRGLLGWASDDKLPAAFKLLQSRIVEPHSLEGDFRIDLSVGRGPRRNQQAEWHSAGISNSIQRYARGKNRQGFQ